VIPVKIPAEIPSEFPSEFPEVRQLEKYHGAANDFLFLSLTDVSLTWDKIGSDWSRRAVAWCDRRRSIGADGLVIWKVTKSNASTHSDDSGEKYENQRLEVAIWNSDGSIAATCGNALRCLALALWRRGFWDGSSALPVYYPPQEIFGNQSTIALGSDPFATLIGHVETPSQSKKQASFEVCMGAPRFLGALQSPWNESLSEGINALLKKWKPTLGLDVHCDGTTFVQLANPHLVMVLRGITATDSVLALQEFLNAEGQQIKDTVAQSPNPEFAHQPESFPNSEFQKLGDLNLGALFERAGSQSNPHVLVVHERGAGVTQACGSGCTAAYAAQLKRDWPKGRENASNPAESNGPKAFRMPGGDLTMRKSNNGNYIMGGPAEFIAAVHIE
jgi:diaminopimelate epimerase